MATIKKAGKATETVVPASRLNNSVVEPTALVSETVLSFMKGNNFVEYNRNVGKNVNEYPFVTFIDGDNKAENVYFSKGASKDITGEEVVDAKFLSKYVVVETTNADGETRIKLARKGGNRGSIAELIEFETL